MRQWTAAAAVAGDLQGSMSTALGRLGKGHDGVRNRTELQHHGLSTGMDGLDSADTLRAVLATWDKRLAAIQDECGWLESALRRTGRDLTGTDAGVRATVDAVKVPAQAEGR
ncbi:hypothetical protein ACIBI4_30325 [Streptomyces sp. NPDC050418]|uniref:hypothetical protein n=1 Tax=Streptomyces sp. NPDC050418 TaxID=3365612 RepID=UPI00378C483E